MVTQYDEKGKVFTQVVSKEPVRVTIQTTRNTIEGMIHVRQDTRVKDELNNQETFLAVTGATVFNDQREAIFRSEFLIVNRDQIIWLIPEED